MSQGANSNFDPYAGFSQQQRQMMGGGFGMPRYGSFNAFGMPNAPAATAPSLAPPAAPNMTPFGLAAPAPFTPAAPSPSGATQSNYADGPNFVPPNPSAPSQSVSGPMNQVPYSGPPSPSNGPQIPQTPYSGPPTTPNTGPQGGLLGPSPSAAVAPPLPNGIPAWMATNLDPNSLSNGGNGSMSAPQLAAANQAKGLVMSEGPSSFMDPRSQAISIMQSLRNPTPYQPYPEFPGPPAAPANNTPQWWGPSYLNGSVTANLNQMTPQMAQYRNALANNPNAFRF